MAKAYEDFRELAYKYFAEGYGAKATHDLLITKHKFTGIYETVKVWSREWRKSGGVVNRREKKEQPDDFLKSQLENVALKREVADLRNEIKTLKEFQSRQLNIVETLKMLVPKMPKIEKVPEIEPPGKKKLEHANLLLSDHHAGEVVIYDEMQKFNQYDFDVFADRMYYLTNKTIKLTEMFRQNFYIPRLNLYLLGDMVSGDIHWELAKTNTAPMMTVVLQCALVYAQSILMYLKHFPEIWMIGIVGNHGRTTQKKEYKHTVFNNYDWLLYQILSLLLIDYIKDERIKFVIPPSTGYVVTHLGWKILCSHGDNIQMYYRTPYYGIENDSARDQKIRRKLRIDQWDFRVMGHFHQPSDLRKEVLMNGSLIGPNEYSLNKLKAAEPPCQKFFGLNEKYGISWQYDLNVSAANGNEFQYDLDGNNVAESVLVGRNVA